MSVTGRLLKVIPITQNNENITWKFNTSSYVSLFKHATRGDLFRSNEFNLNGCTFCLELTPNGWRELNGTILWCALKALPEEYIAASVQFKYKCNDISFEGSKNNTLIKQHTEVSNIMHTIHTSYIMDSTMEPQQFANLNSFTFECTVNVIALYNKNNVQYNAVQYTQYSAVQGVKIMPVKQNGHIVAVHFHDTLDVQLFKKATHGTIIRSDYFTINECELCLAITPNGWNDVQYRMVWYGKDKSVDNSMVYKLPENVGSIGLNSKYKCDSVSFKAENMRELTTQILAGTNNKEWSTSPDKAINHQRFANLNSFIFVCEIDILAFYDKKGKKFQTKINNQPMKPSVPAHNSMDNLVLKEYGNLITGMQKYKKLIDGNEQKGKDKSVDNIVELLDEFYKLLEEWQNFSNYQDRQDFCDISKCNMFIRNYRDRQDFSTDKAIYSLYAVNAYEQNDNSDIEFVARCQILDKIHCFCSHSNNTLKTIKNRSNRYNQFTDVNEEFSRNKPKENKQFIYGWEFHYDWKEIADEKQIDDYKIHCSPAHRNLKQEITQNNICTICLYNFNIEYNKAGKQFESRYRKNKFPYIALEHILALMIYCNFDVLSAKFSTTYREHDFRKHFQFYYLGKLLKELILKFGTEVRNGKIETFYHGTSKKLIFAEIVGDLGKGVRIHCPLSTSTSKEVAINFTDHNKGLVIEFGGSRDTKYFSCAWLSDFQNESECLFLQNKHELQIKNIIDCTLNIEYSRILNALKTIDAVMVEDFQNNVDAVKGRKKSIDIIVYVIEDKLSKTYPNEHQKPSLPKNMRDNELTLYERELTSAHFEYKKSLSINHAILEQNYQQLFKLFCLKPKEWKCQWVNVKILSALFPKVTDIEIKNIKLCKETMKKIVKDINTKNPLWKLKKITIKANEESELTIKDAVSQYQKDFIQTTMKVIDNKLLLQIHYI